MGQNALSEASGGKYRNFDSVSRSNINSNSKNFNSILRDSVEYGDKQFRPSNNSFRFKRQIAKHSQEPRQKQYLNYVHL